ncbi:hypothetical protein J4Q44_G00238160 [Coregonus suidteri]|uniref:RNase H type-1 domain-containing protein n=1 Tax=Coregonus suidteri TaxID=861788 RepID=A0AAN8LK06_9TELE
MTLFVDGSAYIDQTTGRKHAGFAVTTIDKSLHIEQSLPDHFSAQQAELLALTTACEAAEGKTVNIYSDSAYAIGVCLSWAGVWKARGFTNASRTPIKNNSFVLALISAMKLPAKLAIIKVQAQIRMRQVWEMTLLTLLLKQLL